MGRAVSSLVIASLLMCPLVCRTGHAARHAGGMAMDGCCEHHSRSPGRDDACPEDRSPSNPGHSCQCICGGAVVDNVGTVTSDFDWGWSVPLAPVADVAGLVLDGELQALSVAPWPDVGMNHGRALCCLYNTFLC